MRLSISKSKNHEFLISLKKNKLRIFTTKRKSVKVSDIHYFLHFFLALLC